MRIIYVTLLAGSLTGAAWAETVPLPRPRPPLDAATEQAKMPAEPPPPSACFLHLQKHAVVRQLPNIDGPGACGGSDVVELEGIILPDGGEVAMKPAATFRCEMAEETAAWVRDDLAPVTAAHLRSPLRALENYDSYSCRGRNRVKGAKLSEHGKANAFDLHGLRLVNGKVVQPTDQALPKDFRDGLRISACRRFRTVLGPSSDGFHEDHIHVDLAARRNDYRLCEWDVLQPFLADAPFEHLDGKNGAEAAQPASVRTREAARPKNISGKL